MRTLKPSKGPDKHGLQITFGDRNPGVANELAKNFCNVDAVRVIEGDLLQIETDAVVCAANSFGDMGGGFDKAIDDRFEGEPQKNVRRAIEDFFMGELPVG